MFHLEAFQAFRKGLALLRDDQPVEALPHIQQATQMDPLNPYYLSYLGLLIGAVEGKWAEAEKLCHQALKMDRKQAQLYLNLADIYLMAGRRQDASDTLGRGLHHAPRDYRLKLAHSKLIVRRPPVLPFLERTHLINRSLGLLRHRALRVFAEL